MSSDTYQDLERVGASVLASPTRCLCEVKLQVAKLKGPAHQIVVPVPGGSIQAVANPTPVAYLILGILVHTCDRIGTNGGNELR